MRINTRGVILPTVLFFLLLFFMLGAFLTYLFLNAIDNAAIGRHEMVLQKGLRQALIEGEMMDAPLFEIDESEQCQLGMLDAYDLKQKMVEGRYRVKLAESCQLPYVRQYREQEWLVADGLGFRRDRYLMREDLPERHCVKAGWCYDVVEGSGYNNRLLITMVGSDERRELSVAHQRLPHQGDPSFVVAIERWREDGVVILDSEGEIWLLEGERPAALHIQSFGTLDHHQGGFERLNQSRYYYNRLYGDHWYHFWIESTKPVILNYQAINLQRPAHYQINRRLHLEEALWDGKILSLKKHHRSSQWYYHSINHRYVDSGATESYLYLITEQEGRRWLWLFGWDGEGLLERSHLAYLEEWLNKKKRVELIGCAPSLKPVMIQNWQIGCRLDRYSNYSFVE